MYQVVDKGSSARQGLKDERECRGSPVHSTIATTTITIISVIISNFCINTTLSHKTHVVIEVFDFFKYDLFSLTIQLYPFMLKTVGIS